jgi:hypothetical protein
LKQDLDQFEKKFYENIDVINKEIESNKKKNSERTVKIKKDLSEAIKKNQDNI